MLIDKELHQKTKDVTIDYVSYGMGSGFRVSSENPVAEKKSSCTSNCCSY